MENNKFKVQNLTEAQNQQALIKAMLDYIGNVAENPNTKPNDVQRINDDWDYIVVKYFREELDGDKQQEYSEKLPLYIDFAKAFDLLAARVKNSL